MNNQAHAPVPCAERGRRPASDGWAVLNVFRTERRKLMAQLSVRVLALVCLLGPFAFSIVLSGQSGVPADTLLGTWVHASGYDVSFVVLGFAGYLGFPVIAGALAGDLFSSEDRYGTWKSILTRAPSRRDVFMGKVLAAGAFTVGLVGLAALSSLGAGLLLTGDQPLVGLGGTVFSSGECLWLVIATWLVSVLPMLAFTSIALLFSVVTRSGITGVLGTVVVGLLMQLLALVGNGVWVHLLLVSSAFDDWHGLLSAPRFYGPLAIGCAVSVVWVLACLSVAWLILRRRDFAGPPVTRRAGWVVPARAVIASVAAILLLGWAVSWGSAAITPKRLEASFRSTFDSLAVLQQKELGRPIPRGEEVNDRTICRRRSGATQGPGDDWSCTVNIYGSQTGASPFRETSVAYDVSAKSNGCYKAEAPSSFVGQQLMSDAHRHSVVNPLFTIYGCFDITTTAPPCPSYVAGRPIHGSGKGAGPGAAGSSEAAGRSLHEAEQVAGPKVMSEIEAAQRREERAAREPAVEVAEGLLRTEAGMRLRRRTSSAGLLGRHSP